MLTKQNVSFDWWKVAFLFELLRYYIGFLLCCQEFICFLYEFLLGNFEERVVKLSL